LHLHVLIVKMIALCKRTLFLLSKIIHYNVIITRHSSINPALVTLYVCSLEHIQTDKPQFFNIEFGCVRNWHGRESTRVMVNIYHPCNLFYYRWFRGMVTDNNNYITGKQFNRRWNANKPTTTTANMLNGRYTSRVLSYA